MPVTGDELRESLAHPTREALDAAGLDLDFLVKKLKSELKAKISKTQKLKGGVNELPRGFHKVTTTGFTEMKPGEEGPERVYSDGETLIQWGEAAWDVRQRARIEAHKLRGDYPTERHQHDGGIDVIIRDCVKEGSDG
jgi:hypothetical protein